MDMGVSSLACDYPSECIKPEQSCNIQTLHVTGQTVRWLAMSISQVRIHFIG